MERVMQIILTVPCSNIFFAVQITGVEDYMESTAMGIVAARQVTSSLEDREENVPSKETMIGALIHYITELDFSSFQLMNANFGLLDPPEKKMSKSERKAWYAERALKKTADYANRVQK